MPFFYVAGNHDITNVTMERTWQEKFGRRYYHFVYKDVLFLILCSEDPPGMAKISPEQIADAKLALEDNKSVRWTIVCLHRPIWTSDVDKNGWGEVEKLLTGRNYTVFVGHEHHYQKFVRNGMNYYQLATTGGGSRLRGVKYGEFDHVVWVTMKKTGPVLANLMLDGIYPEDLKNPDTVEPVEQYERKKAYPVKGFVYCEGSPPAGATIAFFLKSADGKSYRLTADAVVEGDGSFRLSSAGPFDGAPAGDYAVTVVYDGRYAPLGEKAGKRLPEKYAKALTTDLKATVKNGVNDFTFDMSKGDDKPPLR
jgi:serine/threonine-protein phosphatase CPPED1